MARYLPSPLDVPPVEGVDPEEARQEADAQARSRRAVLRPGVQDARRQARRPGLRARLLRHAQGQQPRAQSRQGREGKRRPALAHSGRRTQASRQGRGRRHRRHHRPAALDHRRHALRRAKSRSCSKRFSFPRRSSRWRSSRRRSAERKKLADTLEMLKRQDPTFRAGDSSETGPDAHQRHGRVASGSHQASPAARLQAEREGPQAARQLSRNGRVDRRSRRANVVSKSPGRTCSPRSASRWSRPATRRSSTP